MVRLPDDEPEAGSVCSLIAFQLSLPSLDDSFISTFVGKRHLIHRE